MKVTYSPEGEGVQTWDFVPDKVRQSEAELAERRFGGTWNEFRVAAVKGDSRARRVLLWHLMRRQHHTLRYEDTPDFALGELKVEMTRGELVALREQVDKSSHPERDSILAALDSEIDTAEDDPEPEGKAS